MNTMDMKKVGLQEGDVVDLTNEENERLRIAKKFIVVAYDIPHKCVATYFPEANVLVPIKSKALKSNTPASKSVVIKVAKHVASND